MEKRQLAINMTAGFVVFFVNLIISFFVSPYIIARIGKEAYGFTQLAGNFVSYGTIATTAINSMLSRFIAIKVHQGDMESANRYYMSAFVANIVIATLLVVPAAYCVVNVQNMLQVPMELIPDVRLTFLLTFFSFLLFLPMCVFNAATFVRNKLYLGSIRNMQGSFIRIAVIFACFALFPPKVYYLPLAAALSGLFVTATNMQYTQRLLPDMHFNRKYISVSAIKDLFFAGIWNVVTKLSSIFSTGLDLLVTNIFIDASSMGILSVAKMLPNLIISFVSSVTNVFLPNQTKLFAQGKTSEFVQNLKQSMKIMGVIVCVPVAGLVAFGDAFFRLWMPSLDSQSLAILSFISIAAFALGASAEPLYNVFVVMNKLKVNSMVLIGTSFLSILITIGLLKTTDLGIYAIAGTSTAIGIIRILTFVPIFSSHLLRIKWYSFYGVILKNALAIAAGVLVSFGVRQIVGADDWVHLLFAGGLSAPLIFMLGCMITLRRKERMKFILVAKDQIQRVWAKF